MTPTEPAATASMPRLTAKRLNLQLSERAYKELETLARQTNRSITEMIRFGMSLLKIAVEEHRKGNKLVITTANGDPLKEIVLPDS